MTLASSPEQLVYEVLADGYFGAIDKGDLPRAISYLAEDVEMVFDPEDDLRGRAAVLAQLASSPPKPGQFHRIDDVIAAERERLVVGCGSLLTSGGAYRFAVIVDRSTQLVTHFVTQLLPRSG